MILKRDKESDSYNIYISGVGGQGIIKFSIILGEAAINTSYKVVMSEIHGMAQRGGVVFTELKIGNSNSSIIPEGESDLLISFEPLEALRVMNKANKDTVFIVNTSPIMPFNIANSKYPYPDVKSIIKEIESNSSSVFTLNAEKIAEESGNILSMNMVMLGAAAAIKGFPIKKEDLINAMNENLPLKTLEINKKAFERGYDSVKSSNGQ